jgi:hypothetical protein
MTIVGWFGEYMNWSCLKLMYQRVMRLEGSRKDTTTIGQNSLDQGPPKYETGLLTARPGCPSSTVSYFCELPYSANIWLLYESILVRVCCSRSQNWCLCLNAAYTDFYARSLICPKFLKIKLHTIRCQVYQRSQISQKYGTHWAGIA